MKESSSTLLRWLAHTPGRTWMLHECERVCCSCKSQLSVFCISHVAFHSDQSCFLSPVRHMRLLLLTLSCTHTHSNWPLFQLEFPHFSRKILDEILHCTHHSPQNTHTVSLPSLLSEGPGPSHSPHIQRMPKYCFCLFFCLFFFFYPDVFVSHLYITAQKCLLGS